MIPVDERWWREYRSIDDVVVYEVDVSEDDRREALAAASSTRKSRSDRKASFFRVPDADLFCAAPLCVQSCACA